MRWSLTLLLQFLIDSPRLLVGVPSRWMQSDSLLSWRDVLFLDTGDLLRADSATRVCGMNINTYINIAICCEKKLSSLPPSQLIPRSNSGEISVSLAVHNPPLFLYFCTLEILPSWITIFLIIYLFRLIPLFYLSSFLLSLFSTFNFAPITPNNLYNTFKLT